MEELIKIIVENPLFALVVGIATVLSCIFAFYAIRSKGIEFFNKTRKKSSSHDQSTYVEDVKGDLNITHNHNKDD